MARKAKWLTDSERYALAAIYGSTWMYMNSQALAEALAIIRKGTKKTAKRSTK
jgi:hypothetical protein